MSSRSLGISYLAASAAAFLAAALLGLLLRTAQLADLAGSFRTGYHLGISLHGYIMMYLFLTPVFHAGIGNLFLPSLLGVSEVRLPRLGRIAFWVFAFGALSLLAGIAQARVISGWLSDPVAYRS